MQWTLETYGANSFQKLVFTSPYQRFAKHTESQINNSEQAKEIEPGVQEYL